MHVLICILPISIRLTSLRTGLGAAGPISFLI